MIVYDIGILVYSVFDINNLVFRSLINEVYMLTQVVNWRKNRITSFVKRFAEAVSDESNHVYANPPTHSFGLHQGPMGF